jgi:hypothetical protein
VVYDSALDLEMEFWEEKNEGKENRRERVLLMTE